MLVLLPGHEACPMTRHRACPLTGPSSLLLPSLPFLPPSPHAHPTPTPHLSRHAHPAPTAPTPHLPRPPHSSHPPHARPLFLPRVAPVVENGRPVVDCQARGCAHVQAEAEAFRPTATHVGPAPCVKV
eukprot:366195-Chlamydomonas_euryale.AAC.3